MSSSIRKRKSPAGETTAAKRKVQSTTTKAGVADFFKPSSQKEPEKTTWRLVDKTLLVGKYLKKPTTGEGGEGTPVQSNKIAGFDLVKGPMQ